MGKKNESISIVSWGDGKIVKVKKPKLNKIPGDSVICPKPCNPVGETGEEWLEKEKKSRIKTPNPS